MRAAKPLATTVKQSGELSDRYAEAYATSYLENAYENTQQWVIAQNLTEDALLLPNRPLQQHTVQVSHNKVESTLDELRLALARPAVTPKSKQLSEEAYSWLIRPIESNLQQSDVSTLVFVLDGSLRSVPMSALYSGERYLIEDYSIALTPGLQLIAPRSL